MSIVVRLIETESGTTIYSARTTIYNADAWSLVGNIEFGYVNRNRIPSNVQINKLVQDLSGCLVDGILSEEPVPES